MKSTLTELFLQTISRKQKDDDIFFTKEDDEYTTVDSSQLLQKVYWMVNFFRSQDLKKGDRVAIISENRVEWVVTDFACMFSGLVSVPVYVSLATDQIKYILQNSESKICFVSNSMLLEKVLKIRKELPHLQKVIVYSNPDLSKYTNEEIELFADLVSKEHIPDTEISNFLQTLSGNVEDSDLLTIIYTSGTTGIPKGVMLSHKNIHSNVMSCQKVLTINEDDVFLSYLPYSHAYERTAGYYLAFFCGAKIYYAQNIETIARQLTEANPTIVITVPRLLDKIYNKLMKSGEDMNSGLKKKLFLWAIKFAGEKKINKESFKWKIADKLVYKKIRAKTGEGLRFFVSGGGALNKSIGEFFDNIGVTVLEGYGLTETSPVISVNPPHNNKYGTVGKPLHGVNVKLSPENEIMVSGELVMCGYFEDEKATSEMIKNGWLHTGDIGELDSEGFLKITDRKKSLFKTSGGKYVAPTQIEDLVSSLGYIENVVVIGNERMYVTALLVLSKQESMDLAKKNNIQFDSFGELIKDKSFLKIVQKDVEAIQKELSAYEKIRKFTILENAFSIETGELTPTLKVKRKFVEEKFKNEIEGMYLKV